MRGLIIAGFISSIANVIASFIKPYSWHSALGWGVVCLFILCDWAEEINKNQYKP